MNSLGLEKHDFDLALLDRGPCYNQFSLSETLYPIKTL
jgi:hypothetical protein